MTDIFDTRFKDKELELDDNKAVLGDDVNLSAKDETLRHITLGAGWDLNAFNADALDLDISVLMLDRNNMTLEDQGFVFYNSPEAYDGSVKHNGDNRTGAGDGDDETITIDLQGIPFDILKILVVLSVYKGGEKEQSVGMIRNAYVRVVNADDGVELVRYQLDDVVSDRAEPALVVGAINREGPKWHFVPMAEFEDGGLAEIASRHGMVVGQQ